MFYMETQVFLRVAHFRALTIRTFCFDLELDFVQQFFGIFLTGGALSE